MTALTPAPGLVAHWPDLREALHRVLVKRYGMAHGIEVALLTVSENATYVVLDTAGARRWTVRVHRPGYHAREQVLSELAWLTSLREDDVVATPTVVPAADGELVVAIKGPDGVRRYADCFEFLPGATLDDVTEPESWMTRLGAITARMHRHARAWDRPDAFDRFRWDAESTLGLTARWGSWRALCTTASELALLERAERRVLESLPAFTPADVCLVHADLKPANLMHHEGSLTVIDFDDAGISWPLFDAGAAMSFMEALPGIDSLIESWARGYATEEPLSGRELDLLPTFVVQRRLMLTGWVSSHPEATLPDCVDDMLGGTLAVAERYLALPRP